MFVHGTVFNTKMFLSVIIEMANSAAYIGALPFLSDDLINYVFTEIEVIIVDAISFNKFHCLLPLI